MMNSEETPKELSVRIHYDWIKQCRTCEFWSGDRARVEKGVCKNEKSKLHNLETSICGYCEEWSDYDCETAVEVSQGKWDHLHGLK